MYVGGWLDPDVSLRSGAAAGICDSINNMRYNGVLVSDKDLASLSLTKTSGRSIYKGEREAHTILKKENMSFDSLKAILPQLDQSGPDEEHKLKEKGHHLGTEVVLRWFTLG